MGEDEEVASHVQRVLIPQGIEVGGLQSVRQFCCRVLVSGCAEEGRKEGLDRYKHEVDDAMHYSGKLCLFLSQGELIYLSVQRN